MREILFRGKRVGNGKWVYGSYVIQYGAHEIYLPDGVDSEHCFDRYHVLPETVGQYTGLKDKNGEKIFEGDIVRDTETSDVGAICFETNTATFVIEFDSIIVNFYDYNNSDVEVIGNIHDNHELLEGGE